MLHNFQKKNYNNNNFIFIVFIVNSQALVKKQRIVTESFS